MLGHGNILADMGAISAGTGAGAEDSIGSWLPLHHDMGLFLHLTAGLMFGNPIALMPATAFVRRPLEWLRMMERYASTITGGPNFAFELCTRLIRDDDLDTLDLSRLRIIHNGSEPIHAPTLAAFAKRFARTGLRPEAFAAAYGMAEATVFVTSTPPSAPPTVLVADRDRLESAEAPALVATTAARAGDRRRRRAARRLRRPDRRPADPPPAARRRRGRDLAARRPYGARLLEQARTQGRGLRGASRR